MTKNEALARYLDENAPTLVVRGTWSPYDVQTVAVFAAEKVPGQIILEGHDLAQSWRKSTLTVLGGFHSSLEEEVWDVLWPDVRQNLGGVILVKVLARGMLKRMTNEERTAIDNGRLILVSPFPGSQRRATRQTAYRRNLVASALADTVLILHAYPESSTFKLAREVLSWGKEVYTLDSPANLPLLDIGVRAFKEEILLK